MNELESILNYLETTSLEPHDDYTSEFTYKEQKLLWNYIKQLKEQLEEAEKEYDRTFGLWHNRKLIKKFDDEYNEEYKKNNPERDYAYVLPDAEEVYKRYYELKEKK